MKRSAANDWWIAGSRASSSPTMSDWFDAQIRYYQRCLLEGRDPGELRGALAARRDSCLARLFDVVTELHDVHEVSVEELVRFVDEVLTFGDGLSVPVEE
jgi:hypothetical protein